MNCLNCTKTIRFKSGTKPSCIKKRKFCTKSCAATFNNKEKPKRARITRERKCARCSKSFVVKRRSNGKLSAAIYCTKVCSYIRPSYLYTKTKGQVFTESISWQAARSTIQRHARRIYRESGRPNNCYVCEYDTHVNVSHIKAVSEFSDEVLIAEINSVENLLALCPNHHWEFDHGLLTL